MSGKDIPFGAASPAPARPTFEIPQLAIPISVSDTEITEAWRQLEWYAHARSYNAGWWHDVGTAEAPGTMQPFTEDMPMFPYVIATKLHLITTEVSEGSEGYRVGKMDDKLPHRPMLECELADAVLRILDVGKALDLDVIGAILEKSQFNTTRPDHGIAKRLEPGGKKF
jgi:hypothetical protein